MFEIIKTELKIKELADNWASDMIKKSNHNYKITLVKKIFKLFKGTDDLIVKSEDLIKAKKEFKKTHESIDKFSKTESLKNISKNNSSQSCTVQ